jgi:phosphatidylglycerophosphate synthase
LGGSFNVSYARARAEGLGVRCTDGWLQRAERLMFLATVGILTPVLALFFGFNYGAPKIAVLCVMAVLSNITAVTRLRSVYHRLLELTPVS